MRRDSETDTGEFLRWKSVHIDNSLRTSTFVTNFLLHFEISSVLN
jgi:hypothetical protein